MLPRCQNQVLPETSSGTDTKDSRLVFRTEDLESLVEIRRVHLSMYLQFRRVSRQRTDLYEGPWDKPRRIMSYHWGHDEWNVAAGPGWVLVLGAPDKPGIVPERPESWPKWQDPHQIHKNRR